jgi:uncharacterized protein YbaP (TraB family)
MFPLLHHRALRTLALTLLTSAALTLGSSAREPDTGKHYLWRITNVPQPFYLLGSIHALSGYDYPLPKAVMDAFHESKRVLFELDLRKRVEFSEKWEKIGKYPFGQTIMNRLHPHTLAFLQIRFRNSHIRFDEVKDWKAWRIAELWGIPGWTNVADEYGVDNYLAYHARRAGKEIDGLESIDEHVAVLGDMSDLDSEILLLDTIAEGNKRRDTYNSDVAAWKRGDVATIWANEHRLRAEAPWISSRLLDMRNLRWIPKIISEIKSGKPTMIVAGAAHFAGPPSIIKLLEVHGYKFEQL